MSLIPTWDKLLIIRRLNIYYFAKWAAYLVPIFLSLELFIENHFHLHIPLPVNMVATYFAALLFLLSSLLVDILCPDLVKENKTFFDFLCATTKSADFISEMQKKSDGAAFSAMGKLFAAHSVDRENLDQMPQAMESFISDSVAKAIIDEAQPEWTRGNKSWLFFRTLVLVSFICSALAGAYISFYDAPLRVIRALAHLS